MYEVRELNYLQIRERLKFLAIKYPNYKLCINTSPIYNPSEISGKSRFNFGKGESNMLCYVQPRFYEKYKEITVTSEVASLNKLNDKTLSQKAIITTNSDCKSYYISGVYVDEEKEIVVLLNAYFEGLETAWKELDNNNLF